MAKAEDYNPTQEQKDLMRQAMKVKRMNYNPSFDRKNIIWRKRNLKVLEEKSNLDPIAVLWADLSSAEKTAWETAAAFSALTGYQLFTQDTCYRIENGLSGVNTPNNLYQYKVGAVIIPSGIPEYSVTQYHYAENNIFVKNVGQKNAYTFTEIIEDKSFPLDISFNLKTNIVDDGASPVFNVRIYCVGKKDGLTVSSSLVVNLTKVGDWRSFTRRIDNDWDTFVYYIVDFNFEDVSGYLYFDNPIFEHTGQNWAFDPRCDNIRINQFVADYEDTSPWEDWPPSVGPYYDSKYIDT